MRYLSIINFYNIVAGFLIYTVLNYIVFGGDFISAVTYRVISALLALIVLINLFLNGDLKFIFKNKLFLMYFGFSGFYVIRIFYDTFYKSIQISDNDDNTMFFSTAVVFIFILPLSLISLRKFDILPLIKVLYYFYSLPFLLHFFFNSGNIAIINDRQAIFEGVGINVLSTFTAILLLWSLFRIVDPRINFVEKIISFTFFILSAYNIALTATRSSIIAIFLVISVYILRNLTKYRSLKTLYSIILFSIIVIFTSNIWSNWFVLLSDRFEYFVETGSTGRNYIYDKALDLFWESPFIGNSFVLDGETFFHNIFLDAYVTTGVFGGLLFTLMNFKVIIKLIFYMQLSSKYLFIIIGFLVSFIYGLFSSNLFSNYLYWSYLVIAITIIYDESLKVKNEINN